MFELIFKMPKQQKVYLTGEQATQIWDAHVQELDGHWKGRVQAWAVDVPTADKIEVAMEYFGAINVARKTLPSGRIHLSSTGYWANGF